MANENELQAIRMGQLLAKKFAGSLTADETAELEHWRQLYPENQELYDAFPDVAELNILRSAHLRTHQEKTFQVLRERYYLSHPRPAGKRKLYHWLSIAASLLLAIGSSLYFALRPPSPAGKARQEAVHILRGHYKASLQMADGEQISLKQDKQSLIADACGISYADGTSVLSNMYPDHSGVMYRIQTPAGGQYKLTLPDGSTVRLNARSTLRFPLAFTGKYRNVELSGEGYFEVARGSSLFTDPQPFIVRTHRQAVRVLGTAFNIEAYREDDIVKTTLIHGAVQVLAKDSLLLAPEEQAVLHENGTLSKHPIRKENVLAWSEGYFDFTGKNAVQILHELARWYGLEVVIKGKKPNIAFSGKLRRDLSVREMLDILGMYHLALRLEGNKLIVQ